MKGGAHPSPFAALSFPNSEKVPIYCWVDRDSFAVAAWRSPASNSQPYGDFLHRNRAALTTRPRRLSSCFIVHETKIRCCQRVAFTPCSCPHAPIPPPAPSHTQTPEYSSEVFEAEFLTGKWDNPQPLENMTIQQNFANS